MWRGGDAGRAESNVPVLVVPSVPVAGVLVQDLQIKPPPEEKVVHGSPGRLRVDSEPKVRLPQSEGIAKGVKRPRGVDAALQEDESGSEFREEGENVFLELFAGRGVDRFCAQGGPQGGQG
jgi:hypothetical protein